MSPPKTVVRQSGFQRPYSNLQIATWMIYPIIMIGHYALIVPMLDFLLLLSTTIPYFIFSLWAGISGYNVTNSDPVDPSLCASEKYRKKTIDKDANAILESKPLPPFHESCFQIENEKGSNEIVKCHPCSYRIISISSCLATTCVPRSSHYNGIECDQSMIAESHSLEGNEFCYYCQKHVSPLSKHCRYCDKCVHRFDHHCQWLNNCVGSANYRDFLMVIGSTLVFTVIQLCLTILLAYKFFANEQFREKAGSVYGSSIVYIVLLLVFGAMVLPVVILIAQLAHFHFVLVSARKTTYEFVTEKLQGNQNPKSSKKKTTPSASKPLPSSNTRKEPSPEDMAKAAKIIQQKKAASKEDEGDVEMAEIEQNI